MDLLKNLVILFLSVNLCHNCYGRAAYDSTASGLNFNFNSDTAQVDKVKFPTDAEEKHQEFPAMSGLKEQETDGSASKDEQENDDTEVLKDLPDNIDLNNLTPEQKEVFDELVALAGEEDSQVQGRTFGLIKHKFLYLWNKFASLFSPHKFFEFEHIPAAYNYNNNDYTMKRVEQPQYPVFKFPSILGGITRFFANTIQPQTQTQYNSFPHGGHYGQPIKTYSEDEVYESR